MDMQQNPDLNSLINRVVLGDDLAFAELCGEYEPLVRSMSLKYAHMADVTDEKEVLEDFSQEATLALYRAAKTYNGRSDEVSFGLYAKVCVRNALVSELRRLNRKRKTDIAERRRLDESEFRQGRAISGMPNVGIILNGDLLSPFEKKIFAMYVDGMKVRDIAKSLGKSSKSVSNAVYRIKEKIKIYVTKDNSGFQPKGSEHKLPQ